MPAAQTWLPIPEIAAWSRPLEAARKKCAIVLVKDNVLWRSMVWDEIG
jgi:hypothetical protein